MQYENENTPSCRVILFLLLRINRINFKNSHINNHLIYIKIMSGLEKVNKESSNTYLWLAYYDNSSEEFDNYGDMFNDLDESNYTSAPYTVINNNNNHTRSISPLSTGAFIMFEDDVREHQKSNFNGAKLVGTLEKQPTKLLESQNDTFQKQIDLSISCSELYLPVQLDGGNLLNEGCVNKKHANEKKDEDSNINDGKKTWLENTRTHRHQRYFSFIRDVEEKDVTNNEDDIKACEVENTAIPRLDRKIFNECAFLKRFGSLSSFDKEIMKQIRES